MANPEIALKAIQAVNSGNLAYCKFLSANDTGATRSHQSGIYITKEAVPILFQEKGKRGTNSDRWVKIKWQDDFTTDSRFIYYGKKTRNEYRITQFGKNFSFLDPEHTGDLFVFVRNTDEEYSAYVLQTEEGIDSFLDAFGMSPIDTGKLIQKENLTNESKVSIAINSFIEQLEIKFPSSSIMSKAAQEIYLRIFNHAEDIIGNPDKEILKWTDMEFHLFRKLEYARYADLITTGFKDVDEFISIANMVLNRRKSRAGKSLEHHLSAIFKGNKLQFESQVITEGNKRPDFIFPSSAAYHNPKWSCNNLTFLGAKTTCKDRWRQIVNEADRIDIKYLFTLQQGISEQQINEMESEKVILVIPKQYLSAFPEKKRESIWTLKKFIAFQKEKQIQM